MKRLPVVLVALLVAGGAAWFLRSREPAAPTEAIERPTNEADREPPEPVTLQGRAGGTSREGAREAEGDAAGAKATPGEEMTRRLRGVVTDERDLPVEGVVLQASTSDGSTMPVEVVTGRDGTFAFEAVPGGPVRLDVRSGPEWRSYPSVQIPPEQTDVRVRLRPGVAQRLLVLDAYGDPAAGVAVHAEEIRQADEDAPRIGRSPGGVTDEKGAYVLGGMPPGARVDLRVGGGKWPELNYRDVAVGDAEVVLRLPEPCVLEGFVVDERGHPLGKVPLDVDGCDPRIWNVRRHLETDAETGGFRFEGLTPGRYRLDVSPPKGYSPRHAEAFVQAPQVGLRVQLAHYVDAAGTVQVEHPQDVVVLWCLSGERKAATPGADGAFSFTNVPDLPATLYARDTKTGEAFLREGVRPGEGPFTIRLEPALTIQGTVPGFSSARHAPVMIGAARGPLLIEGKLAPDDTFRIEAVPPGTWAIDLWELGERIRVENVEAGATDVVVPLPDVPAAGGR